MHSCITFSRGFPANDCVIKSWGVESGNEARLWSLGSFSRSHDFAEEILLGVDSVHAAARSITCPSSTSDS